MKSYLPLLKDPNFPVYLDMVERIERESLIPQIRFQERKAMHQLPTPLWRTLANVVAELREERIREYNE